MPGALNATGDGRWEQEARRSFEWFLGRNDLGLALYEPAGGGCYDGLQREGVNINQGAESTLAFLLSLAELSLCQPIVSPTAADGRAAAADRTASHTPPETVTH